MHDVAAWEAPTGEGKQETDVDAITSRLSPSVGNLTGDKCFPSRQFQEAYRLGLSEDAAQAFDPAQAVMCLRETSSAPFYGGHERFNFLVRKC
jgi:hypothetical protein